MKKSRQIFCIKKPPIFLNLSYKPNLCAAPTVSNLLALKQQVLLFLLSVL